MKGGRLACLAILLSAATGLAGRAWADESWKEYSYPDKRIAIQFPAPPEVGPVAYLAVTPDDREVAVPASVLEVRRGGVDYRVTVADLSRSPADDPKALEHLVAHIRARRQIGLDAPVSMGNSSCGRYLGVLEPDGLIEYIAIFQDAKAHRLYDVRARVPASEQAEHGADAVHFQQSLTFLSDPTAKAVAVVYPDSWREYAFKDYGFSIRFPAQPTVEATTYTTAQGVETAATRIWAREGDTLYRVTAANFWRTEADQPDAVDQAVALWKAQGRTLSEETISVMNGQCGRDVVITQPNGGTAAARIFFPSSQHRLLLIEVRKTGGTSDLAIGGPLYFRSSFTVAKPPED